MLLNKYYVIIFKSNYFFKYMHFIYNCFIAIYKYILHYCVFIHLLMSSIKSMSTSPESSFISFKF